MPLTPLNEILDPAFEQRYGVAAINIVNDLSTEAVLAAAAELEAPVILQTSLKTVKQAGAEVVAEAREFGAQVEGEIESVMGVEDDVGSDEPGRIHPIEVSSRFIEDTG